MLENAEFIAAVVALIGAIATFIKSRADIGSGGFSNPADNSTGG